jgi:hypothetical protein
MNIGNIDTAAPTQTVKLPEPSYPLLTRMISDALFPETKPQTVACPHCKQNITIASVNKPLDQVEPITWIVGQDHPLMPGMKVVRMFVDHDGVEVYSVSSDGKAGVRNLVPVDSVRLTEEAMPPDIFVEELSAAEDDGPDPEPEPEPAPPLAPIANGQVVAS